MEKRLYIVRHCKAAGQEFTAPLTEEGEQQTNELVHFFADKPIDRIVSSPYVRAVQTIEPLARQRNLSIERDERFGERVLFGDGQFTEDWLEKFERTFVDFDLAYSGGESNRQAMERAKAAIGEVLQADAAHTVIVSHGNLTILMLHLFDKRYGFAEWKSLSNPDVFEIAISARKGEVTRIWR
ncbi:histidine phosphatase family protein [Anoxybacillus rupiensis]|uniref:Histidine phosphatase family protein n=1 Tax=Anoxybacteroides rupiense TaxID=311460 RepID=A0ABT5VZI7_9BACL|nr:MULTISPECIES: histidine phosphatase family protein [Anoxybacillus]MDE8562486.1 histidine phosphatase family protein [Anoxybacillus rupiensis]QHC04662.1 histidine phosphatase family protein [Anoxybacillus sp. PDR2]